MSRFVGKRMAPIDRRNGTLSMAATILVGFVAVVVVSMLGVSASEFAGAVRTTSYDHVPWQPSPGASSNSLQNIDELARYEDLPPTIFSPTGRLHAVEAAVRASKVATPLCNLLVAMKCRDGLLVLSTRPVSPHLDARIGIANATATDGNITSTSAVDGKTDSNKNTTAAANTTAPENTTSVYPSLFLFKETCDSTGPIFDVHPCVVGATAGNTVDNRILAEKLLLLGMRVNTEDDVDPQNDRTADRLAKDLANQLQVVTQDLAAAQKQKLGRMLASSAVILGNQKLWRVDPTGQFWDCQATVLGPDADRAEVEFYRLLEDECSQQNATDVHHLLENLSHEQALGLAKKFLKNRMTPRQASKAPPQNKATDESSSTAKPSSELSSQIYWQAMILDYSFLTKRGVPKRISKRGTFGIRRDN